MFRPIYRPSIEAPREGSHYYASPSLLSASRTQGIGRDGRLRWTMPNPFRTLLIWHLTRASCSETPLLEEPKAPNRVTHARDSCDPKCDAGDGQALRGTIRVPHWNRVGLLGGLLQARRAAREQGQD